jgi:hypothetical protein
MLLHPPLATAAPPSKTHLSPLHLDDSAQQQPYDATSSSFLPQLFAAFHKEQFAAAAAMLPAVAVLRARAAAATASHRDHDALHNALQVTPRPLHTIHPTLSPSTSN